MLLTFQEIIVNTVFLGVSTANPDLQDLSEFSNGRWCIVNDVTDTAALSQCFVGFTENTDDGDSTDQLFQVVHKYNFKN